MTRQVLPLDPNPMKIAVASDHRGFTIKGKILDLLKELGEEGFDFGPVASESVDYPDFASKVAEAVSTGTLDRGILICGGERNGRLLVLRIFGLPRVVPLWERRLPSPARRWESTSLISHPCSC